ncbi:hypothetical protein [Pectobacterium phage Wc4-1]|uniref:Uncharacterized protein n=1 Tax=Pectobacterium phage Wc4 TaxID=2652428 RepID=A0A5P8D463_9CAUD|nr:hypothetical protein [Pectobacterium phage Wc4]QFP93928.1 hypothetical protein [Pectobacterium phage Wc4-1]
MIIDEKLTLGRCLLAGISAKTDSALPDVQAVTLTHAMQAPTFASIKKALDGAMQEQAYTGFTSEVNVLTAKRDAVRGHDFLKLWMRYYLIHSFRANYIIADAAGHHILSNVLNYEEKRQLLEMMRGKQSPE